MVQGSHLEPAVIKDSEANELLNPLDQSGSQNQIPAPSEHNQSVPRNQILQNDSREPIEGADGNQEIVSHGSSFFESHVIIFEKQGEIKQENVAARNAAVEQANRDFVQQPNFAVDLRQGQNSEFFRKIFSELNDKQQNAQ